ncbi:WD40/YVTN/BNR-like repeat-containing protein [Parapedobacter sp. 10938]|uniref:WD40/YVTN/BNR-like repeat-containing protein n=1 Tax=Parapedobacter flavus TaxID=3110225 RepID=UPI002DB82820|nr:hypothetical protein [Parapedobacter sp. 10938]MEC3881184.1 hypothetical protein [Parapedobacter sp. 10938]
MMRICRKIMMLAAVALFWCCNGEDTLLDLYPMEPIVNPEVGILMAGNGMIHADFDGRQQISGVTETGIFTTTDRFQSLHFEPHAWQATDGMVAFGDGVVVHVQTEGMSFSLRYSMDDGKTWTTFGKPIVDGRLLAAGGVSAVQLSIAADGSVWVLGQQEVGGDRRALLYSVDLEQQRSSLMMEKVGAMALTFGFANPQHGWMLYGVPEEGGRVHVLRTENGGQSWADGALLDGVAQPLITPITADDLLVYNREGVVFRSADGGISFEPVAVGGGVIACQAASSNVTFALLENGLAKSTDGGRTWTALDAFVHGLEVSGTAMDFHGERAGIVYGADRLFISNNGGQSWDVLVYPYDYVFE